MTLLFSGRRESKSYLVHLAFAEGYDERHERVPVWRLARFAHRHRRMQALTIREQVWRPRRAPAGTFYIPCWIGGHIDLAKTESLRLTSGQVKADLRRIRKRSYDMVVERGRECLSTFYEEMYRPYVRNVYGARAVITPKSEVESNAEHAELVLVCEQGQPVAGQIMLYDGSEVRGWLIGVKDGDRRHVRAGAIAAIYHHTLRYLTNRGYERVHAGASRPFLNDGVLRYKAKWGMRISDHASKWFALRLPPLSDGALSFLAHNPFVHEVAGKYYGALFVRDRLVPPSTPEIDALRVEGLAGITLFRAAGINGEPGGWNAAGVSR